MGSLKPLTKEELLEIQRKAIRGESTTELEELGSNVENLRVAVMLGNESKPMPRHAFDALVGDTGLGVIGYGVYLNTTAEGRTELHEILLKAWAKKAIACFLKEEIKKKFGDVSLN